MSIAIGMVLGLVIGGVIGIFLSTSFNGRKLEAQLERSTTALKEAEVLQQQQAQEIQQLQQSPSQMQEIEQSYQIQIRAIEQSYQKQSEELSQAKTRLTELEQDKQQIRQTYQTQLEALEETYQARLQEALQQAQEPTQVLESNQTHIQQIEQSYQTKLQEQQQAHQQAINELEKAHSEGDLVLDGWKDQETVDKPLSSEQIGEKNQENVSNLLQREKSDDLDFFEMLPTDEEKTEDLSEAFTKDKRNTFTDFFESETKQATSDSDELFASFIDTDESEETLMNLLQMDEENKSKQND